MWVPSHPHQEWQPPNFVWLVLFFIVLSLNVLLRACMPRSFRCVWLFMTQWTVAHQAPLSVGFSRQEYWSGLPFPPPGNLPHPGIEPTSLLSSTLAIEFFTLVPPAKPVISSYTFYSLLPGFLLSGDRIAQYVFCKLIFFSTVFEIHLLELCPFSLLSSGYVLQVFYPCLCFVFHPLWSIFLATLCKQFYWGIIDLQ